MIAESIISVAMKSTGAGVVRALGWKATRTWKNKQQKDTLRELQRLDMQAFGTLALPKDLGSEEITRLTTFLQSAEIQHTAMLLSSKLYLGKCGLEEISEAHLQQHLRDLLHLHVGLEGQVLASCGNVIFDLLSRLVQSQADTLLERTDGLPKATRTALMKTGAAIAASQVRNTDLFAGLVNLAKYEEFERTLKTQIVALHSTMRLPHAGTSRSVPYDRLFVQPRIGLGPTLDEIDSLNELAAGESRVVLLGGPGAGKSTSSLRFTHAVASGKYPDAPYRVPFFVPLKEYADRYQKDHSSLLDYLHLVCKTPYAVEPPTGAIEHFLLNGIAVVIFDGLDELLDSSLRKDIAAAVEGFSHRYPTAQIVVTSRRVGYDEVPLDEDLFLTATLEDFAEDQVANYALKWFNLDESIDSHSRTTIADAFLDDSRYVEDLRSNPLMLSLMCGLYSGERYIPRNRPDVYEKCAMLLFEKWDKQRGINAPLPFTAGVQAAIRSLALWLYPQQARSGIPKSELVAFMKDYLLRKRFDDPDEAEEAANSFIDFCKGRAWVLTDVGADLYWFTHQTFLEFFAASQLVRENASASSLLGVLEPYIRSAEWDVVAQLSLQTLGKTVEDGSDDFLNDLVRNAASAKHSERINAIDFACRSLSFIVPRADVLRRIVHEAISCSVESRREEGSAPIVSLCVRSEENAVMVGRYFGEELCLAVKDKSTLDRAFAIAFCFPQLRSQVSSSRSGRLQSGQEDLLSHGEMRIALGSLVPRARVELAWFAAREAWERRMTVAEVVKLHGLRAFYTCDMGGMILAPPPIWNILRWDGLDGPLKPSKGFAEDLYSFAIKTPGPWLTNYTSEFDPLLTSHRNRLPNFDLLSPENRKLMMSLVIIISMPIMELLCDTGRDTAPAVVVRNRPQDRPTALRKFVGHWISMDEEVLDREALVRHVSKEALHIVSAWVSEEVSFTSFGDA